MRIVITGENDNQVEKLAKVLSQYIAAFGTQIEMEGFDDVHVEFSELPRLLNKQSVKIKLEK
jgi:hypothetical protein